MVTKLLSGMKNLTVQYEPYNTHDVDIYVYLKEPWLTGVCNSHDEQSNDDKEVKEEGGN